MHLLLVSVFSPLSKKNPQVLSASLCFFCHPPSVPYWMFFPDMLRMFSLTDTGKWWRKLSMWFFFFFPFFFLFLYILYFYLICDSDTVTVALDIRYENAMSCKQVLNFKCFCNLYPLLPLFPCSYPWPNGCSFDNVARFSVVLDLTMWLWGMSKTWFCQAPWNVTQLSTAWQAAEA